MALQDFVDALPEDRREAYKAEISKAVVIATEADAEKFADTNELLKKANQRYRDKKFEDTKTEFLKNFNEKDLPALLEAERKKGQKSPLEIEMEELKAARLADKRELALEKQKTRALARAQAEGIPAELVERYIGETDEATDQGLEALFKVVKPWAEGREAKVKQELLGNQGNQRGKPDTDPVTIQDQYDKAVKDGNADLALALQSRMQDQVLRR
jgi:hypothetical protein